MENFLDLNRHTLIMNSPEVTFTKVKYNGHLINVPEYQFYFTDKDWYKMIDAVTDTMSEFRKIGFYFKDLFQSSKYINHVFSYGYKDDYLMIIEAGLGYFSFKIEQDGKEISLNEFLKKGEKRVTREEQQDYLQWWEQRAKSKVEDVSKVIDRMLDVTEIMSKNLDQVTIILNQISKEKNG